MITTFVLLISYSALLLIIVIYQGLKINNIINDNEEKEEIIKYAANCIIENRTHFSEFLKNNNLLEEYIDFLDEK